MTLLYILLALVQVQAKPFIGNGVETKDYPAVIKLHIQDRFGNISLCTGTIVGTNTVLTAAHCGIHADPFKPKIDMYLDNGMVFQATEVVIHPFYLVGILDEDASLRDFGKKFDIALIKFNEPKAGKLRMPIHIFQRTEEILDRQIELVGFGNNVKNNDELSGSGIKRKATNVFKSVEDVNISFVGNRRPKTYYFGGLYQNSDGTQGSVLPGDSGGPSILNHEVVAVNTLYLDLQNPRTYVARDYNKKLKEFYQMIPDQEMSEKDKLMNEALNDSNKLIGFSVSLSHPAIVDFLFRSKGEGYNISFRR